MAHYHILFPPPPPTHPHPPNYRVVKVRETRVTAIQSHALIGLSILIMFVLVASLPPPSLMLNGPFLYFTINEL